jgi:antitoxin (DNA-binding transcriptional repressor) of toxin-antitoxin stability system
MITVSKNELKSRMLEYFRRVENDGEELIVTHNRVPVLKVVPVNGRASVDELFADARAKARIDDDALLAPETNEWGEI